MIKIAHISDLHFGRTDGQVVTGLLEQLRVLRPDCIVISGDLTQRAKKREYAQTAGFLAKLDAPYLVIPGNHDVSATKLVERFLSPWSKWKHHVDDRLEPVMEIGGTTIAGINTARLVDFSLDWSRGDISSSQAERVRRVFTGCDVANLKILVAHHPFWLPDRFADRHVIYGRNKAIRHLEGAEPDLILSGHVHVPFVRILDGIIISHAGTACSTRLVEDNPNSFNMIEGDSSRLEIQQMSWDGDVFSLRAFFVFEKWGREWRSPEDDHSTVAPTSSIEEREL